MGKEKEAQKQAGQKTLPQSTVDALKARIDELLAGGHHDQGGVADLFWENPKIRKALQLLAEAPPMQYLPPRRKRFAGDLLDAQDSKVNVQKSALLDGIDVKTGTMDGWGTLMKLHWLAKSCITRKGLFFEGAVDCSNVESMNGEWTLAQLEGFLTELGGEMIVAAMVLDGPNVNKGALRDFEAKHPTVAALLCICCQQ